MASTTVNFNLKTAGFVNYANQTLSFRLLTAGADKADSTVILPGIVTATSAADGTGSVALFRNGDSDINSIFEVIFPNREKSKFLIPEGTASIELSHLMVDHVPSGSDTQQSSVYAEAIKRANHTGTQLLSTISNAGTIASQASNNVSISGGSISGVTLTASTANLTDATNKRLMTDAQETKLDSVETDADVTDTTNVTSAGALMDSEVTDLFGIKSVTISTLQVKPSEGAFANGDKTKLDGIEASADVTDTANVTSAGALMDSEVDANVKTLSLPASTTISTFAKTFLDDANAASVKTTLEVQESNILATTTLGYKVGSGGTVTQATNKTTAVTLDQINGEIVMNAEALADGAAVVFAFTNSTIAATDVIIANAAGNFGAYQVDASSIQAGSCKMIVRNASGGSLSEATKINFAVIKAVKT